ncbi:hypothetical protein J27TS8_25220 [Robertmurraya siralis]|uniref:Type I restriction modification DNA specificity domain-containing protein n=1 Tax=Robertmurraya siralis TaxID=77777 RepID=A0A919WIS9_9BACI|nr:restriction endonuclease subunit S [Robertmurraya siralis]GIN62529.1 hypothetical protein J27TS8_25220 [Robertmurraya siralis]
MSGRNKLSKIDLSDSGTVPVYSSDTTNNGIMGFTSEEADYKVSNDIPIYLIFGDHTRSMNIATSDFCVMDNVKVLIPFTHSIPAILFISAVWKKTIPNLGYARHWSKAKESILMLPTSDGVNPDYDFMESFMAELEIERVNELDSYLTATDLKDCKLTEEEERAIKSFNEVEWKEYQMKDLFEKIGTKKLPYKAKELPKEPTGKYILPCLTSSFMNQGLNYYAPEENATILKNVISIPSNSDVYRAYFQSREFTVLSDAYAIKWIYDDKELSKNQYLFTVTCINEVTDLPKYSYKNKLGGWNVVRNKFINLPIKNNKPDYEFMETLISAIKKLVIKDTVVWVNKKAKQLETIK